MEAIVYFDPTAPVDVDVMKRNIVNLVNATDFGHILTRSELVTQMLSDGATRVDLGSSNQGMKLRGYVLDGKGTLHRLERDDLDIRLIERPEALLVPETVVFGAEIENISIETIADA